MRCALHVVRCALCFVCCALCGALCVVRCAVCVVCCALCVGNCRWASLDCKQILCVGSSGPPAAAGVAAAAGQLERGRAAGEVRDPARHLRRRRASAGAEQASRTGYIKIELTKRAKENDSEFRRIKSAPTPQARAEIAKAPFPSGSRRRLVPLALCI